MLTTTTTHTRIYLDKKDAAELAKRITDATNVEKEMVIELLVDEYHFQDHRTSSSLTVLDGEKKLYKTSG